MSALKICPQCGTEYELDQRFCPKDGSTLKTQGAATDLVGSVIHKSYHVLRKLGEGGMGTVYLAEHVKMGRKSAVKVINPGMVHDADAISRFNREAANASKISHPNVAAVYDFGETEDGLVFLAMEFIEGPSLTKVINELGSLPPLRAADITRQASEALSVAHDMGIVHRDLKPDNIMLAKNRDGSDCVKVVDFGIAKAANVEAQKVTKTGLVVGTPEYMSPEQLAGDKLDGRSDTYSLALVAFNMLTGKLPFPADSQQESMILRLTDRPKQLAEMKPDVAWSAEVQAVLDRALERDVEARFPTASDFGRELFRTVQAMPSTDATKAFTAVMAPAITPSAPPSGAPAPRSPTAPRRSTPGASKDVVPPTKVAPATPPAPRPAVRVTKKNNTLMVAGVAIALVLGVGGAWYGLKDRGPDGRTAAQQGDTTKPQQLHQAVGTVPPTVNLPRELEQIAAMPDTTPTEGHAVLARLQALDSVAQVAEDSTLVRYRFMRGKAMMASGDEKAGCDSLNSIQGKLEQSRFKGPSRALLRYCAQR